MLRQEYQLDGNVEVDPPDLARFRSCAGGPRNTVGNSKLVVGEADRLIVQSPQTQFKILTHVISILSKHWAGSAAASHAFARASTSADPSSIRSLLAERLRNAATTHLNADVLCW